MRVSFLEFSNLLMQQCRFKRDWSRCQRALELKLAGFFDRDCVRTKKANLLLKCCAILCNGVNDLAMTLLIWTG